MNKRTLAVAVLLAAGSLTACSTTRSGGEAVDGGSTTSADPAATDLTTTTETPVETTVAPDATATTAAVATTAAATAPATAPPTPAPTTTPCRSVPTLFVPDLALDSVDVRRGDCGQGVKDVQEQLNYRASAGLSVDGRFGPATETAVRNFQTSVGLPATGVVNGNTWVALVDDGT